MIVGIVLCVLFLLDIIPTNINKYIPAIISLFSCLLISGYMFYLYHDKHNDNDDTTDIDIDNHIDNRIDTHNKTINIYCCGQQTKLALEELLKYINAEEKKGNNISIKLAVPNFNIKNDEGKEKTNFPEQWDAALSKYQTQKLNSTVFGLRIPEKIVEIINIIDTKSKIKDFIKYGIDDIRLKKGLGSINKVIDASLLHQKNTEYIERLKTFATNLSEQKLNIYNINSNIQWDGILTKCGIATSDTNWKKHLHKNQVLGIFGYPQEVVKGLLLDDEKNKNNDNERAIEWISKLLTTYNILGAISDVVNLAYAVTNRIPLDTMDINAEDHAVETMDIFIDKLRNNCAGCWIPDALFHDAEKDDMLSWYICSYISKNNSSSGSNSTPLYTYIQLTNNTQQLSDTTIQQKFDNLAVQLSNKKNTVVFRDADSKNGKAINLNIDSYDAFLELID